MSEPAEKSEKWHDGYADGVWAHTWPREFGPKAEFKDDPEYQAGYQEGFAESKKMDELG